MDPIKQQLDTAYQQLTQPGAPFEIVTEEIGGESFRVFRNAARNLRELFAPAYAHGDRDFVVYEGERWSFARLMQLADSIAFQLIHRAGVGKGDRVAIAMRNYPEWLAAYIGIGSCGAVIVPLNSWWQARELEQGLVDSGARIVFCDQQRLASIVPRLRTIGVQAIVARVTNGVDSDAAMRLEDFIRGAEDAGLPEVAIGPDDIATILYTSGTTGTPKGAVSTHRAVCQAIACFECSSYAAAMTNPDSVGRMMQSGFAPAALLAMPLFHVSGCYSMFLLSLRAGRKLVMLRKWDPERALAAIETERVTMMSAAPAMILELLDSPRFGDHDTRSLCGLGAGGAATPPRISQLMLTRLHHPFAGTGWGMTETNALGSSFTGSAYANRPGSAGFVQPIVDLAFRDAAGNEVPAGTPGEIWVRSVAVIREYWNRPDANASNFSKGWFRSGDVGCLDGDGYLVLSDRAKDMVIRGGENIYPAEIEAVAMDIPGVIEVAAFGVPDEKMGEELAVLIRVNDDTWISADEVREFLRKRLAGFKVPRHIAFSEVPLPRNAMRKVLKNQLRDSFSPG